MHSTLNKQWLPTTININLKEERSAIDFNQEQLATFIQGGEQKLNRYRGLVHQFAQDPILRNSHFFYEMTREEKMEV